MIIQQTPELFWLTAVTALTGLLWVPYILKLIIQLGPISAMAEPTGLHPYNTDWPKRATRAHRNAVENLAVFAPLVLLVVIQGLENALTAGAAIVFFWARLVHYVVYTLQLPYIRTLAFVVGFGCQVVLALRLFAVL